MGKSQEVQEYMEGDMVGVGALNNLAPGHRLARGSSYYGYFNKEPI